MEDEVNFGDSAVEPANEAIDEVKDTTAGVIHESEERSARHLLNKYPNAAHPNRHGSLVMFLVTDDRSVSE